MRGRSLSILLVGAALFAIAQPSGGAAAQSRTDTMLTEAAAGNAVTKASVAPAADENGGTVWQGKNWYVRVIDDADQPDATDEESEGTLSIVPAPPPVASVPTPPPAPLVPDEAQPNETALHVSDCVALYQSLAQRLLYLRGIDVDPAAAGMVLTQAEIPYSPLLTRTAVGLENRYLGGSLLISALSWDTPTQQMTSDLAHCLVP